MLAIMSNNGDTSYVAGRDFERLVLTGGEKLLARLETYNPTQELKMLYSRYSMSFWWDPINDASRSYSRGGIDLSAHNLRTNFELGAAVGLEAVLSSGISGKVTQLVMGEFIKSQLPETLQHSNDRVGQMQHFDVLGNSGHARHPELDELRKKVESVTQGEEPVGTMGKAAGCGMGVTVLWMNEAYHEATYKLNKPSDDTLQAEVDWDAIDWNQPPGPPLENS